MDLLAATAERVAATGSRNEKIAHLAAYLTTLDDADLARAVLFLSGSPFAASDPRKMSVGYATMRAAVEAATGWDSETLAHCYREVGDSGETIAHLCRPITRGIPLSLAQAETYFHELQQTRLTQPKIALLTAIFRTYSAPALKFFVKAITGNLRIGLQEKMVEEAVALAAGRPAAEVRAANNRAGDLAAVALAARRGQLDDVRASLFHPLDFMLAQPLDAVSDLEAPEEWLAEDKYDGIRSQLHVANGKVRLFTRGLEDTTDSFPEVVLAASALPGPLILDGEILAFRDGRALPFQHLQQRIARKKVAQKTMEAVPVVFLAYDILMHAGELVMDQPIESRRALLEALPRVEVSPQHSPFSHADIEALFTAAKERGNEGLVLKRRGSVYESGRRGGNWRKVKRPYATLDVVVTAAEQGHGRRAGVLSDVTFAVRDGDRFLNIGKAYSGLTDEEIRQLTKIFRASTVERYAGGRVQIVKPQVVLEVAFDGIQKSPRHKSGYALRFPRIVRWRTDKTPEEADTMERVQQLFDSVSTAFAP
ncbi:MAG TPA: ATP-dependent DNA ligase [Bryobacteraceae bacterium]|nr:ATP-dependent DNA ligase [Bryobacteraceae bacterium]